MAFDLSQLNVLKNQSHISASVYIYRERSYPNQKNYVIKLKTTTTEKQNKLVDF